MVSEVFYQKVGRKYVPVSEWHDHFSDSLSYGDHLVSVFPGGSSRRKITPDFAPVIAATRHAKDSIARAIMDAASMRPQSTPVTEGQRKAWKKLAKEFGDELCPLTYLSAADVADAAAKAMQIEADKMLTVPAVKAAYDHFMFVYQLTKENEKSD